MIATLLQWVDGFALAYMLALNSFYALLLLLSIPELWSHWHLAEDEHLLLVLGTEALPPLTILVPAYNEELTIVESVTSFLTLQYPYHEVVLVNDGSTDATMSLLVEAYDLYQVPPAFAISIPTATVRGYYRSRRYSKLLVVDKENGGGKADALNAALNAARFPYVLAVDVNTLVEPDALLRLARPFLLGKPVAAVGGTIRVANACTSTHRRVVEARVDRRLLPAIQSLEYLRAFLFGRLGWNRLGGNVIISGAFGLFKRAHLLAIAGYRPRGVTEDIDLVVRLRGYLRENHSADAVCFIPDPVAWTEAPTSVRVLGEQRQRWHHGLLETLWTHRGLLFNSRYGTTGLLAFPFFLFGEALAPLVELVGYVGVLAGVVFGAINLNSVWLFMSAVLLYGMLLSVWSILLEQVSFRRYTRAGDVLRLLSMTVIEAFGYRQLTLFFRLKAFWRFVRGDRRWRVMPRQESESTGRDTRKAA